ncbi:MAG: class I SAM-dependent methyltransferase [Sphingomonadales bacterium]|nr:class I SAM-dependent methyltransferase [Sphingomonadales bacterium]MBD3772501.1 class I SAM-dependent methyltransferase [Paracoccaceae bacterium]
MNARIFAAVSAMALAIGGGAAIGAGKHGDAGTAASVNRISAAVSAPDRPEDERALDESRKPVAVLAYLGLQPGMDAADLIPGAGYWSEIMGHAVAPGGTVTALQPDQFYREDKDHAAWAALEGRAPAVRMVRYPFEQFTYAKDSFDFAIMNLNYHDLYWQSDKFKIPHTDPDAYLRALYGAMKPGGIVGIIDHAGPKGDTRAIVDATHRIAPETVIADFKRAGFVLDGRSDMLANPDDDHSKLVFDPSVRGKTDRFILRFRKPR